MSWCVRTLFDQSEHSYSVRHGVYLRFSTNLSTVYLKLFVCINWLYHRRFIQIYLMFIKIQLLLKVFVIFRLYCKVIIKPTVYLHAMFRSDLISKSCAGQFLCLEIDTLLQFGKPFLRLKRFSNIKRSTYTKYKRFRSF